MNVQITGERTGFKVGQVVEYVRDIDEHQIFVESGEVAKPILRKQARFINASGKLI